MYEPLAIEVYTGPGGPIALDMSHADWRKEVDSTNVMRLQQQLRECQQRADKERSARLSADSKRKSMENEREEFIHKLEEVTRAKSQLEQSKIDLDAKIRNIQYQLTEETEKRKNCEVLYNKTKEQLARKEDQYTNEVEAKQKTDLSLRNLQMEIRTTQTTIKQLEEEKEDLSRQLTHERNARMLQEQINEEQVKFQQTLGEDLNKSDSQAEMVSRVEAADESKKQAFDTIEKVKAEMYATKLELERVRTRSKDDHEIMTTEIDELHQKIEELKGDIKLNEEALAHASLKYNLELTALKTENSKVTSCLEAERVTRDKLEVEVTSLKTRLESTVTELDKAQEARNNMERQGYTQQEDLNRQVERRDQDVAHLRESNQTLTQRLNESENKVNKIESEMHIANATLIERTNQLSTLQRDLDQRRTNLDNLDENYRKSKEENARLEAKMEGIQERLTSLQHENLDLKRQLDENRLRASGEGKEDGDKFSMMLSSLREDHNKQRVSLEERNLALTQNVSQLKEELLNSANQRRTLEQQLQQVQEQVSSLTRARAVSEAGLELANKAKEHMELEVTRLQKDSEALRTKLDSSRDKQLEAQHKIAELTEKLDKAEKTHTASEQQLMSQSGTLHAASTRKTELEDDLRKLEVEKAKLEASLKHETQKVEMLQRELDDSHKVRDSLEAMVGNLKASKDQLEGKMAAASATRTLAAQEAEDSRALWETEVKSRSRLGLRIAQLEREKQEAIALVDEEKKKTRKALELKKNTDTKLDSEQNRVNQLQKEVTLLKTHLKAAKKRLKELDTSDHRINALHSDFDRERMELERTLSTLRKQLDDSKNQMQTELDMREQLEGKTRQLTAELSALRTMEKSYGKLEKAKNKLEEDLSMYRTHINSNLVDRGELDRVRLELEARSRLELNQKLEEVNAYLEEQAQARGKLDKMRDTNESDMKKDFERSRNDLLEELTKMRSSYKELLAQQGSKADEAKRFKQMYENEAKGREELSARLEKATSVAERAQTLIDRQRLSGSLYEPGFDKSWASGLSKTTPNYGLNDALGNKMKQELDRSIAKHMEKGPHIDIAPPAPGLTSHSLDDSYVPSTHSKAPHSQYLRNNYFV